MTRHASFQMHGYVSKPWVVCSPAALWSAICINVIMGEGIYLRKTFPRHVCMVPHDADWAGCPGGRSQWPRAEQSMAERSYCFLEGYPAIRRIYRPSLQFSAGVSYWTEVRKSLLALGRQFPDASCGCAGRVRCIRMAHWCSQLAAVHSLPDRRKLVGKKWT